MRTGTLAIAFAASLFAGGGVAGPHPQQFNLECSGAETEATSEAVIWTRPFHDVLRVDLARGMWCREGCWAHVRMARIDDGHYYFADADAHSPTGLFQAVYDPQTGIFTEVSVQGRATSVTHANCVVRPFTGFPLNAKPPKMVE